MMRGSRFRKLGKGLGCMGRRGGGRRGKRGGEVWSGMLEFLNKLRTFDLVVGKLDTSTVG